MTGSGGGGTAAGARESGDRLLVFYDGWCPVCRRSADLIRRLDVLDRVRCLSFREDGVVDRYRLDPERLEHRMQCLAPGGGRLYEGIDAVIQIALRLPPFWPLLPFIVGARLLGLGQPAYDFIASRRYRLFPTGACDDEDCRVPQDPPSDSIR